MQNRYSIQLVSAVDRKSKGRRFESLFLAAIILQLYVVAVLVALKPDSTLNVEIFTILLPLDSMPVNGPLGFSVTFTSFYYYIF